MATQNPIEQEGTYPLPEAQTDRFLFKLLVDYPSAAEEASMMQRWGQVTQQPALAAVSSGAELLALRAEVDRIHVARRWSRTTSSTLVRATRTLADNPDAVARQAQFRGVAPRHRSRSTRRAAPSPGSGDQDYLSPALVQELAPDVLRHRLGLTYEAEAQEITPTRSSPRSSRPRPCRPLDGSSRQQPGKATRSRSCGSSSGGCATRSRTS